jgi:hypothetical protein
LTVLVLLGLALGLLLFLGLLLAPFDLLFLGLLLAPFEHALRGNTLRRPVSTDASEFGLSGGHKSYGEDGESEGGSGKRSLHPCSRV